MLYPNRKSPTKFCMINSRNILLSHKLNLQRYHIIQFEQESLSTDWAIGYTVYVVLLNGPPLAFDKQESFH